MINKNGGIIDDLVISKINFEIPTNEGYVNSVKNDKKSKS